MANKKELRSKIASIKNTQKITKAMEMVAASKMRKTQDRMRMTQPYSRRMAAIISRLSAANPESDYVHPFLEERPDLGVGVILMSTERGLCGGLNANLFRAVMQRMRGWAADDRGVEFGIIGKKASQFFASIGASIIVQKTGSGEMPHLQSIRGVILGMIERYRSGAITSLHLAYNEFANVVTQKPRIIRLLPLDTEALRAVAREEPSPRSGNWDYIYEPSAPDLLDALLTRYLESLIFQALVENNACEQAARMVAMKNASDNAGSLIKELQLYYNKARQAAITQEIAEIVAGASAV